jgi:formate hydrogenlyase subunit 6/NADH:ubiquinone oxidoreductase subunit I
MNWLESFRAYNLHILRTSHAMAQGMGLTWQHFWRFRARRVPMGVDSPAYFTQADGPVTIQYPQEQIPVPDVGRYRLYMETEDCIGCDQCARICPVDCITIEKIKSVDVIGLTSDGTKKRFYLPTFDIDMAKCCYCGLCTIVCPTECIVMTKAYDFAEYDREQFIYHFGNLDPQQAAAKTQELADFEAAKKAAKQGATAQRVE